MNTLEVNNLSKKYPSFSLDNLSFSLEKGYIMGFIGANGAGKSTTIKAMLNLTPRTSGTVKIEGFDLETQEAEIKKRISYVHSDFAFEKNKKIKQVAAEVKPFYDQWDDSKFNSLLQQFHLDKNKRLSELSSGMLTKFYLTLAVSHNPSLLILDEPMSAMDPSSRDEVIRLFQDFIKDGQHSVIYSTHITSDLEKCADYITYIKNGKIIASTDINSFKESYVLVRGTKDQLTEELKSKLIGYFNHEFGFEGLLHSEDKQLSAELETAVPDIDTIMIYIDGELAK